MKDILFYMNENKELQSEVEEARDAMRHLRNKNAELLDEISELKEELEATKRMKLLKKIWQLKAKLNCSKHMMHTLVMQRDEAIQLAERYKNKNYDSYKPSKEEVARFYGVIRGLLDCEDDENV